MYQGKKIVQPPYLKAGDKVALVSPAYWVPEEAILQAAEVIKSWGLRPVIGPHTTSLNVDAYSGTADERASDMLWALEDDGIRAIVCSRGGYGSLHLLNRIPVECYQQHPKWLIGHGDITTLLYAVAGAGVMCVHGPMSFQIASNQEPATSITQNILFGTLPQYKIASKPYNRCGHAEGILIGGNLSSYAAITGTKYNHSPKQDIILFVEEVEESLHAIDRLFYTLRLQMDFERVKGIIFGSFNSIKRPAVRQCRTDADSPPARLGHSYLLWIPSGQQQLSAAHRRGTVFAGCYGRSYFADFQYRRYVTAL